MPTIAEYKEFFFRFVTTTTGASPDKESGFPVKEMVLDAEGNPSQEFNRFLKKHFPSEKVYQKLFASIAFKLNSEDTASTDEQGLVRIAIGSNINDRKDFEEIFVNGNSRKFTTIVVPSTLPIVSAGSGISVNTLIRRVSDDVAVGSILPGDRELYYIDYEITNTVAASSIDNIGNYFRLKITKPSDLVVDSNDADLIDLGSHTIPANTLITNNDSIEYKVLWLDVAGAFPNGKFQVFVGNDADVANCYQLLDLDPTTVNAENKEFTGKIDIDVVRDDIAGCINTTQYSFYEANALGISIPTNPKQYTQTSKNIVRDGGIGPATVVDDALGFSFQATHNDPQLDWSQPMFVHFRYKMNGAAIEDFTHNYFNIFGKTLKDA